MKITRRRFLKSAGLGAAAAGAAGYGLRHPTMASASRKAEEGQCYEPVENQLFDELPLVCPGTPLAKNEMRITFMGTSCIARLSQQGVSVYVEVGWVDETDSEPGHPLDYAMFDCGMGVLSNYVACKVPYARMDKIFIAHIHADHMSELSAIYCFGEAGDRKGPLYVWGPGPSGVPDPVTGEIYEDGIDGSLAHLREVWRWHTESFSFSANSYTTYSPPSQKDWGTPVPLVPVGPRYRVNPQNKVLGPRYADPYAGQPPHSNYDAYALVPIQLDWTKYGAKKDDNVAYWNKNTGLKITHFPAIHTRKGAISYKLEWTPPGQSETISMIYSGDTKPNWTMVDQASNVDPATGVARGIDVLIHEMVMPPDQWASRQTNTPVCELDPNTVAYFQTIENSSHTTQAAFGYLMSQLKKLPRLTVATHFQAQDDTISSAIKSLAAFNIPRKKYTFAADLMTLNLTTESQEVTQSRADASRFSFGGGNSLPSDIKYNTPKYHQANGSSAPDAQIDNAQWIPYTDYNNNGIVTYDADGYNYTPNDGISSCPK